MIKGWVNVMYVVFRLYSDILTRLIGFADISITVTKRIFLRGNVTSVRLYSESVTCKCLWKAALNKADGERLNITQLAFAQFLAWFSKKVSKNKIEMCTSAGGFDRPQKPLYHAGRLQALTRQQIELQSCSNLKIWKVFWFWFFLIGKFQIWSFLWVTSQ